MDKNRECRSQANIVNQMGAACGKLQPANTAGRKRGKYVSRYPFTCDSDGGTLASVQENVPYANNAA